MVFGLFRKKSIDPKDKVSETEAVVVQESGPASSVKKRPREPQENEIASAPARRRNATAGFARIIAVANQKGGVGKTTTTVNLAACLAEAGQRVLLVDIDPQANATSGIGMNRDEYDGGIYEVLVSGEPIKGAIVKTAVENLSVAPASLHLAGAEVELVSAMSRERKLLVALEEISSDYDFILIDCPPSLGLLTLNGLTAAKEVLVPIQCEYYALEGVSKLSDTVELVRANLNPDIHISGVLLTMFDARTKLSEQVAEEVRRFFPDTVFRTVVPRSVRLSEAPSHGLPINLYYPNSTGSDAYRGLAQEVISRG